jgi:hypothetical protein
VLPLATEPLFKTRREPPVPSLATRKHLVAIARFAAAFGWVASAGPVAAQQYAPPPDTSIVCPAIDEDGMLCSADFMSGNCADFVSRADQLGAPSIARN